MFSQRIGSIGQIHSYPRPPIRLPVDDEGYLEPMPKSPLTNKDNHTPTGNNVYMDLLSDQPVSAFQFPAPQKYLTENHSNYARVPDLFSGGGGSAWRPGQTTQIDNLEYHIMTNPPSNSGRGNYHELGIPVVGSVNNGSPAASSLGPSSIHLVISNPPNSGKPPSLTSNGSSGGGIRSAGLNGIIPKHFDHSSSHEYYNDYDQFNSKPLKLQPVPVPSNKHETNV